MIDSRSVSSSAPNTCTASEMGRFTYSASRRPFTRTARLSGFSRSPWQAGHGRSVRNSSSSSCAVHVASACRRRRFGIRPSKSLPNGSAGGPFLRDLADWPVSPPGPNSRRSRCFFGSLPNGVSSAMPNVSDNVASASRTSLRSPRAHGAMAPSVSDLVGIGHDARRVEVPRRAQPLAGRARAVRRVERERARRHLGHADAAVDARHLAREQPVAFVEAVDDDDVVGQLQGGFHRLGEASLDPRAHDQPIDDDFNRMVLLAIELDVVVERLELAVDARLGVAALDQRRQLFLELALSSPHQRRQDVDALVLGIGQHEIDDAFERLAGDLEPAVRAMRHADVGKQQPQVVVDLGDRAHRRPRVAGRGLLLDGNGRRQSLDAGRRRASPSARETAARRPTATRRTAAGPRRRSCRRRGSTCPIRSTR